MRHVVTAHVGAGHHHAVAAAARLEADRVHERRDPIGREPMVPADELAVRIERGAQVMLANPDAAVYISRRRVNDAFLRAALESFHKDGPVAFEKCARENPASYLKIFALLVPRELKIEHANPASALSDEQLAQ